MQRVSSLQVLRFFAALGVVYDHAALNFRDQPASLGAFGVDVFFVISGFVIAQAADRRPGSFLQDRLTRILPIYWLLSLPWTVTGVAQDPGRLVTSLTLWPAFRLIHAPFLEVGWTLSFELLFYAAMWLVLRGARPVWLVLAWALAWLAALATHWAVFRFLGSPIIIEFLAGVALARLPRPSRWSLVLIPVALAALLATSPSLGASAHVFQPLHGMDRVVRWGAPAVLLVWGALGLDIEGVLGRPLVFLGDASYSLYLSHMMVMLLVLKTIGRGAPVFVACALCVAFSAWLYARIERPLLMKTRAVLERDGP